jgi:hypothetical protein
MIEGRIFWSVVEVVAPKIVDDFSTLAMFFA